VTTRDELVRTLAAAGCVAPDEEADELLRSAAGGEDLDATIERRVRGEPLAWVVGSTLFCGTRIRVDPGVYVPRPHTEWLARRAGWLLPPHGVAVDLCTGSGAVGVVMLATRPGATLIATDRDPLAVDCARSNGVDALEGDLDLPLPSAWFGSVDVMTAVVPYVPLEELHLLPRDVLAYEPREALDGGLGGTEVLERVVRLSGGWLRPGGALLLELGGAQDADVSTWMREAGLSGVRVHRDDDGALRAIEAVSGSDA
jgi:release factor glutamine methyltransferase